MNLECWIEFFEDLQTVRGRSQNTVMAYRRDLELYDSFLGTQKDLIAFYEFMKDKGLSSRSQARVISSVRTYYRFCHSKGKKIPDLSLLRPPKVKAKLPKTLSFEEFQILYASAVGETPASTARNQVVLLMLYGLGCRVSELIDLDLGNFSSLERVLRIVGKGQKERLVPVPESVYASLISYLRDHRKHLLKASAESSLMINERGHRPSRVDIWRWLAAWSKKAGFAEPVHPHRFRHACATSLLENGADLRSIQSLLGHASLQTTQIYTAVTQSNLVRTVDDFHPLSHLKDPAADKADSSS
jgi:integrase/recombinase XerD